MFPCCHSSPEAFHLSFVLKGGGWHGLIIRSSSTRWSCSSGPWYGRRWGNLFMKVELQVVKYIVISQQQFIHMFEEKPYKNNRCSLGVNIPHHSCLYVKFFGIHLTCSKCCLEKS